MRILTKFCDDCKKEFKENSGKLKLRNEYTFYIDFTYWPWAAECFPLDRQNNKDLCRECLFKLLTKAFHNSYSEDASTHDS